MQEDYGKITRGYGHDQDRDWESARVGVDSARIVKRKIEGGLDSERARVERRGASGWKSRGQGGLVHRYPRRIFAAYLGWRVTE